MTKNHLASKFLAVFTIFLVFLSLVPTPIVLQAQSQNQPILIPLEKFVFTPKREDFVKPGVADLEVKIMEFSPITNGSNCKFTFVQFDNSPETLNSRAALSSSSKTLTSKYENASCAAVIKKEDQKSINIKVLVEVTSNNGLTYGSVINFLSNEFQQRAEIVNPDDYTLPLELYIKPEINIILEKKRLFVGDKARVQIEVTNNDTFILKEFSIKNTIPDKVAKIDCDSFKAANERLNGDLIKLPKVEVFADNNANLEAKCVLDQFNFEANLVSLKPKQTTRLNFDISVDKPGKLKFEIGTNLDQGRISKTTEAIEIIVPTADPNNLPGWVIASIFAGILFVAGLGYGYYKYREIKKRQDLNATITS